MAVFPKLSFMDVLQQAFLAVVTTTHVNSVKSTLRACGIDITRLEYFASDRDSWRDRYKDGIAKAESNRTKRLIDKRNIRKARADLAQLQT